MGGYGCEGVFSSKDFWMFQAEWPRAIEELCAFPHIEEAAVLSTCNRMELYVVAVSWHRVRSSPFLCELINAVRTCQDVWVCEVAHSPFWFVQGVREIEEWMSHSSGLSLDELRPHMFLLRDRDATGHLLK